MSLIVPWTYPGGPPCCCIAACPEVTGAAFATATRHAISVEDYNSLYAGGTMAVSFSGSAAGTAVSVFDPTNTCSASGTFSAEWEFDVTPNECTFSSTPSTTRKISGTGSTPGYSHYLENIAGNYAVLFGLTVGGGAFTDCVDFDAGVQTNNRTVNDGQYPPTGGANGSVASTSSLTVILPTETITVPTYIESFGTILFFSTYTNVSGSATGTFTWTPAAP